MSTETDINDHYQNVSLLSDIPEELKEFLPEEDGLSFEEVILQQASVYQSYQDHGLNRVVVSNDDNSSASSDSSEDEGESSRPGSVISQEDMDEAYARSLQELEEEFEEVLISEFSDSANGNAESHLATPTDTRSELSQDDVDPDNMRYEELLNLTETIGVESVGLSAIHISQLPTSIYTSGMFSKNKEESCVVCQDNFKFGKRLITLPCSHQYHSKCITKWLELKKNCPICQKDVV